MRYIVGIDLGTTNCALTFVDTEQSSLPIHLFSIPQLSSQGKVESLHVLPSFCYLSGKDEWPKGSLQLPWKEETIKFVGKLAKQEGARVPSRLVQSAKSWLCNVAANRRDRILPIEAADVTHRLSPVEASTAYLSHLRDAWNHLMSKGNPDFVLEEQEVILTVPASFDEVARSLTIEAAQKAGFLHVTLIEEPQAAFYSWISKHEQEWRNLFKAGEFILVCDVGGGTTDFSLIEVVEQNQELSFQRVNVGDHLLLGGDNIDVTIAYFLEKRIKEKEEIALSSSQWLQLVAEARKAKEELLRSKDKEAIKTIVLQGTGSSVIKGSVTTSITQTEMESLILDGFFGKYSLEEALKLKRTRGFRTMGLPYEDEPSIIKHLAYFLKQSHFLEKGQGINYLLFNGGTLKPESFQKSVYENLTSWFPSAPSIKLLDSESLDLAVARGAAYYGKVRRGFGVAIGGGSPRSYYLKVDVKENENQIVNKALTLLTRGALEGEIYHPERVFSLRANTPVTFQLMTSHVRLHDRQGEMVSIDLNEMQSLPPIQTILRYGRGQGKDLEPLLPVRLGIRLTEIGTIEFWLESQISDHRWNLEFQIKSNIQQDATVLKKTFASNDQTFEKGFLIPVKKIINDLFQADSSYKPSKIIEKIEKEIQLPRQEWGPSILRELSDVLLKLAQQRKLTMEHELRWWNLAGFLLRPGYGFALDDFRIKELWKTILSELKSFKSNDLMIQLCICLRRISGGLNKGQQMQIAGEWLSLVIGKKNGKIEVKRNNEAYLYSEKIRMLASLERLDIPFKVKLGEAILDRIKRQEGLACDFWALARIGSRQLLYGSAGQVIPKEICARWIETLLQCKKKEDQIDSFVFLFSQLAKKTDHRELNLFEEIIQKILSHYPNKGLEKWLLEIHLLSINEQDELYGDHLPTGLIVEESND